MFQIRDTPRRALLGEESQSSFKPRHGPSLEASKSLVPALLSSKLPGAGYLPFWQQMVNVTFSATKGFDSTTIGYLIRGSLSKRPQGAGKEATNGSEDKQCLAPRKRVPKYRPMRCPSFSLPLDRSPGLRLKHAVGLVECQHVLI